VGVLLQAHDLVAVLAGDNGDVRVLDCVSLELSAGSITDVVGPSGSGKTTLLRALARLLPGATGLLALDGRPAEKILPQEWRAQVALLPQKPAIVPGDVLGNLVLPWTLKVRHASARPTQSELTAALSRVHLDVALDRDAARLSVGQQARVALLRVLLTAPKVLLLDEPDAALDEASALAVAEMTREFTEAGGAVCRVRHHRSDGLASRRLHLEHGRLLPAEETV
jgi:putative ABC transport system ATP-binding protein